MLSPPCAGFFLRAQQYKKTMRGHTVGKYLLVASMNKDLEIALRIKADLAAAVAEVKEFGEALEETGEQAAAATTGTKAWSNSNDQLAKSASGLLRDLKAYDEALSSTALSLEEIAAQEQRLDRLMAQGAISMKEYEEAVTKLDKQEAAITKQKAELIKAQEKEQQQLAKQQREAEKQEAALAKSHAAEEKELSKLVNTADKAGAELEKLTADAVKLEAALKAGKITQEDYARAMGGIAARRRDIEATNTALGRLGFNSREARGELITLGRSLATGNFSGAASDILRMSQRVDGAGAAFTRFAIPVAASTAVVAAYAAVTYGAWQENRQFENTLTLTGNAAGLTKASFDDLSRGIEESTNATIGQSKQIALELAKTGRFSSEVIASFGKAAAVTQQITGKSAADIVRDFASMEGGVAKWAAEHNKSMNFVTLEQYNYIRNLEEQGRTEEAYLFASETYLKALQEQHEKSLTEIERDWIAVNKAASEYYDTVKQLVAGSPQLKISINEDFIGARSRQLQRQGVDPDTDDTIIRLRQENQVMQQKIVDEAAAAKAEADEKAAANEAISATDRIRQASLRADRQKQLDNELAQLEKDFANALKVKGNQDLPEFSDTNKKKLEAEIRKRYEEKPNKKDDAALKASESYVKSLEQQAAAIGKTAAEVRLLASEEQKLTDEQQARVNGALIELQWEEERQKLLKETQQLQELEIQLLRAQGKEQEAAQLEFKRRYTTFLDELSDENKAKGKELVDNLLDMQLLQSQLAQVEKSFQKTLDEIARKESSINVQREAGLISEYEARKQIYELHQQQAAELEKLRPIFAELQSAPGEVGENARAIIAAMDEEIMRLQSTMTLLQSTLRDGLESGLTDAILGLADGTMTLRDAVRSLVQGVAESLAQMAAQALAQKAVAALFSLGGDKDSGESMKDGATATTAAAGALSFAATQWAAVALQIKAAAASLAASGGSGGGGGGSSGGSSSGGWMSTLFNAVASYYAADGGHITGPGTSTSDSIPAMLSDNEYVTRAAVVGQPGALNFLHDFNTRGMAALLDWAPAHHSNGGLAGVPAPAMPSPTMGNSSLPEPASAFSATLQNSQNFYLIDDPKRVTEMFNTPAGEEAIAVMISRDPAKFRSILGV